jgi:hypothetical protein
MDSKEKIKILQQVQGATDLLEASKHIPGICYSFDDGVAFVRRDLRRDISDALNREGISIRQLSITIGMQYTNLVQYLKGSRPIPEKYLERILGLLSL